MQNEAYTGFKEPEVCQTGELSTCMAQPYLLLSTHPVLYGFCHPVLVPFSACPCRPAWSPPGSPRSSSPALFATPLPAACPQASASPQRSLASFPCAACKKKSPARSRRAAAAQPLPELQAAPLGSLGCLHPAALLSALPSHPSTSFRGRAVSPAPPELPEMAVLRKEECSPCQIYSCAPAGCRLPLPHVPGTAPCPRL